MTDSKGGYVELSTDDGSKGRKTKRHHAPAEPRELRKFAADDWPVDLYHPLRAPNWTREGVKYNASQDELTFVDRTLCQFLGGASALMSALYGLISLASFPWWVILLYVICVWGLTVGCVWDLYNECSPINRWFFAVRCYRGLNASFASIFCANNLIFHVTSDYNYVATAVPLEAWYFTNIMVATYCGFAAGLGHHRGAAPILGTLFFPVVTQLILLATAKSNGIPEYDSPVAFSGWILLLGVAILNLVSLLVAVRLALYHAVMCVSLLLLTFSLQSYGPEFCEQVRFAHTCPNLWFVFLGFVIGMGLVYLDQPQQREATRRLAMNMFWFRFWAKALKQPPWDPTQLDPRRNKNQPFLTTKAWWMGSRKDSTGFPRAGDLSIPRAEFVPVSQQFLVDGAPLKLDFVQQKGMAWDAKFPHSDVHTTIVDKVRFSHGQDGAYWYPTLFGFTGGPPTPSVSLVQAKYQGTLLEFLVWYGHLSTLLRKVTKCDSDMFGDLEGATHVIDLEWMSKFDTRPDFHTPGGRAFFRLDSASLRLNVVYLMRPFDTRKVYPLRLITGETDWQFDQAEQIILMSACTYVAIATHHVGIHVMMSLVGIALHNGFDTNDGDYFHPWRTAMNLHFYNHIAVTDYVIGILLEQTGVLAQVFPFTSRGLFDFVQYVADEHEFLAEADLDARREVLEGVVPEMGILNCERRFKDIYREYAKKLADVCWEDDAAVVEDSQMQEFIKNLNSNLFKGLPARLKSNGSAKFTTKEQIIEMTASIIHTVTVRHEIVGSLFWKSAFEPYLMQTKLPKDFGPPSVADYQAMIGLAISTSRRRAPKLMIRDTPMPGEKTVVGLPRNTQGVGMRDYKFLIRALPPEDDAGTRTAYEYLQGSLNALYVDMAGTREKRDRANWFLNVSPEMLEVGAIY